MTIKVDRTRMPPSWRVGEPAAFRDNLFSFDPCHRRRRAGTLEYCRLREVQAQRDGEFICDGWEPFTSSPPALRTSLEIVRKSVLVPKLHWGEAEPVPLWIAVETVVPEPDRSEDP